MLYKVTTTVEKYIRYVSCAKALLTTGSTTVWIVLIFTTFGCNGGCAEISTKHRKARPMSVVVCKVWGRRQDVGRIWEYFRHVQKIVYDLKICTKDVRGKCFYSFRTSFFTASVAPKSRRGCTIQTVLLPVVSNAFAQIPLRMYFLPSVVNNANDCNLGKYIDEDVEIMHARNFLVRSAVDIKDCKLSILSLRCVVKYPKGMVKVFV